MDSTSQYFLSALSLPAWGAWIEIRGKRNHDSAPLGRSPHGERGLKCHRRAAQNQLNRSLPAWGAWIEIVGSVANTNGAVSLPAWGAWIEIRVQQILPNQSGVAPRMGSVD